MENFKPIKPAKSEKILISLRMEAEKLKIVDDIAYKSNISRNQFILQSIDFALKHLSE